MHVGGPNVGVVMMGVSMMLMTVVIVIVQQPHACEIYDEPDDRDGNGLEDADRDGCEKLQHTLIADEQGDQAQNDGARERREITELSRAERETRIAALRRAKR